MTGQRGETVALARGDRLFGRPCVVTIGIVEGAVASGWCDTCAAEHVIDCALYEEGRGPWRLSPIGSNADSGA